MLTGVTETCFVLSYSIALLLESTRWFFRLPYRIALVLGMTCLGLITHSLFLLDLAATELREVGSHGLLSGWYDWSLLAALGLALIYVAIAVRRPDTAIGAFFLPMVLLLFVAARFVKSSAPFDRETASNIWIWLHGVSLLVGTMLVALGFCVAWMYLVHSWRLKSKKTQPGRLRLPSLEYLQTLGRNTMLVSAACIAIGLLTGVVLNLRKTGRVSWLEGGILFSGPLLIWLVLVCIAQWRLSKRDLGRWIAYLNIGSFVFMAVALWLVVGTPHGRQTRSNSSEPKAIVVPSETVPGGTQP